MGNDISVTTIVTDLNANSKNNIILLKLQISKIEFWLILIKKVS